MLKETHPAVEALRQAAGISDLCPLWEKEIRPLVADAVGALGCCHRLAAEALALVVALIDRDCGSPPAAIASAPLTSSSLAEILPFLVQIALAVSQAQASGGAQVPIHATAHSRDWTLTLNGTLEGTRAAPPAAEQAISSVGPFTVGEVG